MTNEHNSSSPYISIGERVQQLDMLLHVQEFSSMIVLITGECDIGKSSILSCAHEQLSVHHQVLFIDAAISSNQNTLIDIVAQQLGSTNSLAAIESNLSDVAQHGESVNVLVDDAHLLEPDALAMLVSLSQLNEGWHLILSGDENLQQILNVLQGQLNQSNLYHLIHLKPLSESESNLFIGELYKYAGQDALPLSAEKLHQLFLLSKGVPGTLMELVDVEKETQQKISGRFPVGHVAAILLIGLALLFSYMFQEQGLPMAEEDVIAQLLQQKIETENVEIRQKQLPNIEPQPILKQKSTSTLVKPETKRAQSPSGLAIEKPKVKAIASQKKPVQISKKVAKATKPNNVPLKKTHPLLAVQSNQYVLQLLGVRKEKSAKAFMQRFASQLNSDKLSLYETKFKGKPWFVVVYGPFNTKQLAGVEAVNLGQALKSRPWIRPISKIQEDIRQLRTP